MGNRIICIGREFGSGGHEVAVRLAERLGIKVYEKHLLYLACEYGELTVKNMEDADEKATNPYLFSTVHEGNHRVTRGLPTSEVLFQLQSHEIRRIAGRESCIFVGRCADYVLRDSHPFRIFVYADAQSKLMRCMERRTPEETLSEQDMKRKITEIDRNRARYYAFFSGQKWGARENYDLLVNTSGQSVKKQAAALYEYLRKMAD